MLCRQLQQATGRPHPLPREGVPLQEDCHLQEGSPLLAMPILLHISSHPLEAYPPQLPFQVRHIHSVNAQCMCCCHNVAVLQHTLTVHQVTVASWLTSSQASLLQVCTQIKTATQLHVLVTTGLSCKHSASCSLLSDVTSTCSHRCANMVSLQPTTLQYFASLLTVDVIVGCCSPHSMLLDGCTCYTVVLLCRSTAGNLSRAICCLAPSTAPATPCLAPHLSAPLKAALSSTAALYCCTAKSATYITHHCLSQHSCTTKCNGTACCSNSSA